MSKKSGNSEYFANLVEMLTLNNIPESIKYLHTKLINEKVSFCLNRSNLMINAILEKNSVSRKSLFNIALLDLLIAELVYEYNCDRFSINLPTAAEVYFLLYESIGENVVKDVYRIFFFYYKNTSKFVKKVKDDGDFPDFLELSRSIERIENVLSKTVSRIKLEKVYLSLFIYNLSASIEFLEEDEYFQNICIELYLKKCLESSTSLVSSRIEEVCGDMHNFTIT